MYYHLSYCSNNFFFFFLWWISETTEILQGVWAGTWPRHPLEHKYAQANRLQKSFPQNTTQNLNFLGSLWLNNCIPFCVCYLKSIFAWDQHLVLRPYFISFYFSILVTLVKSFFFFFKQMLWSQVPGSDAVFLKENAGVFQSNIYQHICSVCVIFRNKFSRMAKTTANLISQT